MNPHPQQKVTFTASSIENLKDVRLNVNNQKVKECNKTPCTYTSGPYPDGVHLFDATAVDSEDNTIKAVNVIIAGVSHNIPDWSLSGGCSRCPVIEELGDCIQQTCNGPSTTDPETRETSTIGCLYQNQGISTPIQFASNTYTDYCLNQSHLIQYQCSGSILINNTYTKCPYGCLNGECASRCETNITPESFNWRSWQGKNYNTPIKDQGLCGSCWAYSTIGAIEGQYNVQENIIQNPDLSEQNLVSECNCSGDCLGGWPHLAFNYIEENGVVDEWCMPYQSQNSLYCQPIAGCQCCNSYGVDYFNCTPSVCDYGNCSNPCSCDRCANWMNHLWNINTVLNASNQRIQEIKHRLVCDGPLSVASMNWRHAVVLVGYDDQNTLCEDKYNESGCWIIKNSWGVFTGWESRERVWHVDGYGYIPYRKHLYSDLTQYVYGAVGIHPQ